MSRQGQSKGETRQNGDTDRDRQDGNSGHDYANRLDRMGSLNRMMIGHDRQDGEI